MRLPWDEEGDNLDRVWVTEPDQYAEEEGDDAEPDAFEADSDDDLIDELEEDESEDSWD